MVLLNFLRSPHRVGSEFFWCYWFRLLEHSLVSAEYAEQSCLTQLRRSLFVLAMILLAVHLGSSSSGPSDPNCNGEPRTKSVRSLRPSEGVPVRPTFPSLVSFLAMLKPVPVIPNMAVNRPVYPIQYSNQQARSFRFEFFRHPPNGIRASQGTGILM
jgi:hypothetical protein